VSVLLCVLFFSSFAAQTESPKTSQSPQQTQESSGNKEKEVKVDWREFWRYATVSFGEIKHDPLLNSNFFHAIGTGVIFAVNEHSAYFVTARHMFCDPDNHWHPASIQLRFAWEEKKSIYSFFGVPLELQDSLGKDIWASLEDGSDVAAAELTDKLLRALPAEDRLQTYDAVHLADLSTEVYEGGQVIILGYPGLVANDFLVKAILRQGTVAWTNPRSPADNTFLVDANLYPGNSGGPVMKLPYGLTSEGKIDFLSGGKIRLVGIVSQGVQQDISLGGRKTSVYGIGGIGVIEPASKIRRLIEEIKAGSTKTPPCGVPISNPLPSPVVPTR